MDRLFTDISTNDFTPSSMTSTEERTLRDVVHSSKNTGRNYGSLAKSQLHPTFYISHKVELDDTLQRLALKYTISVQEIKRVNKLWSDAELRLLDYVYIPVNGMQLATLQTIYPSLEFVQNLPSLGNPRRQSSINSITSPDISSSIQSSDSSTFITPATTTVTSSYQDYFSKIDQQIQLTKKSLQSLDVQKEDPKSNHNQIQSLEDIPTNIWKNGRHKGVHHLADNTTYVNITTENSRGKHVSTALQRIQREKDNSDEL